MIYALTVTVMMSSVIASPVSQKLSRFESADLLDLLDAELDEDFIERQLQVEGYTMAPTATPTDDLSRGLATPAPSVTVSDGSGGSSTSDFSTASPTAASRDIGVSMAPTAAVDGLLFTDAPVTSGVWKVVPSAVALAAMTVAAVFLA